MCFGLLVDFDGVLNNQIIVLFIKLMNPICMIPIVSKSYKSHADFTNAISQLTLPIQYEIKQKVILYPYVQVGSYSKYLPK